MMAEADLHLKLDRILAGQDDQAKATVELELTLSMLLQGVQSLIPLFGTQREMLQRLLEAASDETGDDGEMTKLIQRIEAALTQQTADMSAIRVTLQRLPGQVEAAAIDGVRMAVGEGMDLPDEPPGNGQAGAS
jgi:hypothetical protein